MRRYRHTIPATTRVIAFDVYGTMIDVGALEACLGDSFGAKAKEAARLWREKQIEFSFRRGLMRKYVDFGTCAQQALQYVTERMGVKLDKHQQRACCSAQLRLPAFPEVKNALRTLEERGNSLVALTNGTERSVRAVLRRADLIGFLAAVISVDTLKTFKPDPAVYEHLLASVHRPREEVWLISGNAWDIIGAKSCGLKAVWLRRDPAQKFDPWEFRPDATVCSLDELCDALPPLERVHRPARFAAI